MNGAEKYMGLGRPWNVHWPIAHVMIRKSTVYKALIYGRMIDRNLLMYGLSQKIDIKFMFAKMEYLPCQVGYLLKPFMLV